MVQPISQGLLNNNFITPEIHETIQFFSRKQWNVQEPNIDREITVAQLRTDHRNAPHRLYALGAFIGGLALSIIGAVFTTFAIGYLTNRISWQGNAKLLPAERTFDAVLALGISPLIIGLGACCFAKAVNEWNPDPEPDAVKAFKDCVKLAHNDRTSDLLDILTQSKNQRETFLTTYNLTETGQKEAVILRNKILPAIEAVRQFSNYYKQFSLEEAEAI